MPKTLEMRRAEAVARAKLIPGADVGGRTWGGFFLFTPTMGWQVLVDDDGGVRDVAWRDTVYRVVKAFWREARYALRLDARPQTTTMAPLGHAVTVTTVRMGHQAWVY